MELVELVPGDPRWESALPVLQELRPDLTAAQLAEVQARGHAQGLRFTAAFHDGTCRGVIGWRVLHKTFGLRELYVDDLVTTSGARSGGVGKALLDHAAEQGHTAGCTQLALDSGVQRFDAHRFYLRERMRIASHHFTRALGA